MVLFLRIILDSRKIVVDVDSDTSSANISSDEDTCVPLKEKIDDPWRL